MIASTHVVKVPSPSSVWTSTETAERREPPLSGLRTKRTGPGAMECRFWTYEFMGSSLGFEGWKVRK
jgi:hypothetical protein